MLLARTAPPILLAMRPWTDRPDAGDIRRSIHQIRIRRPMRPEEPFDLLDEEPYVVCWRELDREVKRTQLDRLGEWVAWLIARYGLDYKVAPPAGRSTGRWLKSCRPCGRSGKDASTEMPRRPIRSPFTANSMVPCAGFASGTHGLAAPGPLTDPKLQETVDVARKEKVGFRDLSVPRRWSTLLGCGSPRRVRDA